MSATVSANWFFVCNWYYGSITRWKIFYLCKIFLDMMNLQSIIKDLSKVVADNMAFEEKWAVLQNTYKTIKEDLNLFLGVFDKEIENWSVEDSLCNGKCASKSDSFKRAVYWRFFRRVQRYCTQAKLMKCASDGVQYNIEYLWFICKSPQWWIAR